MSGIPSVILMKTQFKHLGDRLCLIKLDVGQSWNKINKIGAQKYNTTIKLAINFKSWMIIGNGIFTVTILKNYDDMLCRRRIYIAHISRSIWCKKQYYLTQSGSFGFTICSNDVTLAGLCSWKTYYRRNHSWNALWEQMSNPYLTVWEYLVCKHSAYQTIEKSFFL
jgi:hypothetical protein